MTHGYSGPVGLSEKEVIRQSADLASFLHDQSWFREHSTNVHR